MLPRTHTNQAHIHETIRCPPSQRYQLGIKIDDRFFHSIFVIEFRRKVPEKYIGWSLWVVNFFDLFIEIRAGDRTIATHQL